MNDGGAAVPIMDFLGVMFLCLAEEFWMGKPRSMGYRSMYGCREGPRDRVEVEGEVVRYLLWGNEIANWNRKKEALMVDDCGWKTQLTMNRLNGILCRLNYNVFSERQQWYLRDWKGDETYVWEGSHMIDLEARRVTPCTRRAFNLKISRSLRRYYEKARRLIEKNFMVTITLDGAIYVFLKKRFSGISRSVLALQVFDGGFKAYRGYVASSKICSAFMKGNAAILLRALIKEGYEITKPEGVLRELEVFDVDFDVLPEHVVSSLALAKLLEG